MLPEQERHRTGWSYAEDMAERRLPGSFPGFGMTLVGSFLFFVCIQRAKTQMRSGRYAAYGLYTLCCAKPA